MSTATENTALAERTEENTELAVTAQQAMARHEIEGSLIIANRFPRNEDGAFEKVMKSCGRFAFASLACYSYPRGGQQIEGASVNLAREVARCWGNIRFGADIVHDDEESRTVRGWAWDLETNTKETQDATFKKLVYRRKGGWIKPDERDLRELTNKHSAIAVRNCLIHLVPPDLIDEAKRAAKATLQKGIAEDVDGHRKRMIRAFSTLGVSVEDVELYLGHPLRQATAEEIAKLRTVYKSISDGNSIWAEYVADKQPEAVNGGATIDDLKGAKPTEPPAKKKAKTTKKEAETPGDGKLFDKAPSATEAGQ